MNICLHIYEKCILNKYNMNKLFGFVLIYILINYLYIF